MARYGSSMAAELANSPEREGYLRVPDYLRVPGGTLGTLQAGFTINRLGLRAGSCASECVL